MTTMTLREAQADLAAAVETAQHDRVLLERDGKPRTIIVGLDNYDAEDFAWASSREFWGDDRSPASFRQFQPFGSSSRTTLERISQNQGRIGR